MIDIGILAFFAWLLVTPAAAQTGCTPNPNNVAPPFVNGCAITAQGLNNLGSNVASNVSLVALVGSSARAGQRVIRAGYYAAGDGGAAPYVYSTTACSLNSGAGDNGSQVQPSSGGGCWNADFTGMQPIPQIWGAKADGTSNDATAINAALAWGSSVGRPLYLTCGVTYGVGATLNMTGNGASLISDCARAIFSLSIAGAPTNLATPNGARLKWTGASGGNIMLVASSVINASLNGLTIRGIVFDGNAGLAGRGLWTQAVQESVFDRLYFENFDGSVVFDLDAKHLAAGTEVLGYCGSQQNVISNLNINQGETRTSIPLRYGAWMITGLTSADTGCNASFNLATNVTIIAHNATPGILLDGGDNNTFNNVRITGKTNSIVFGIASYSSLTFPSNGNTVIGLSSENPALAEGATKLPGCVAGSTCTFGNTVWLDKSNSTPDPTLETGARVGIWDIAGASGGRVMLEQKDFSLASGKAAFGDDGSGNTYIARPNIAGQKGIVFETLGGGNLTNIHMMTDQIQVNSTAGATCVGAPTAAFRTIKGIVTAC